MNELRWRYFLGARSQCDTGLRCDGESVAAISEALFALLDPASDFGAQCAARAQDRAHREFSWQAVMEKTLGCCDGLVR